jgi:hypothetical protein
LAKGFERRKLNCENLTDNGRQVMAIAHIAFGKVNLKKPNKVKKSRPTDPNVEDCNRKHTYFFFGLGERPLNLKTI